MSAPHEFSYWLDIRAIPGQKADSRDIISIGEKHEIFQPNGPLYYNIDANCGIISAEVNPNWGTISEDPDLENNVAKMAADLPNCEMILRCLDEEDKSIQRLIKYRAGVKVLENRARLIPCDECYDLTSIQAVIDYLKSCGYTGVAQAVIDKFRPYFGENTLS